MLGAPSLLSRSRENSRESILRESPENEATGKDSDVGRFNFQCITSLRVSRRRGSPRAAEVNSVADNASVKSPCQGSAAASQCFSAESMGMSKREIEKKPHPSRTGLGKRQPRVGYGEGTMYRAPTGGGKTNGESVTPGGLSRAGYCFSGLRTAGLRLSWIATASWRCGVESWRSEASCKVEAALADLFLTC